MPIFIYFITTAILIVFFYLFTIFTRKTFQEKEILSQRKKQTASGKRNN